MRVPIAIRWFIFVWYLSLFGVVPFWILFGYEGAILSFLLLSGALLLIGMRGQKTLRNLFSFHPLAPSESPLLYSLTNQYCRRLGLSPAKLAIIESPAVNAAVFAFTHTHYTLVFTRGLLNSLNREKLSAILAWQLTKVWHRELACETYLAIFLHTFSGITSSSSKNETYSLRGFLKQFLFYPILYFPFYWMTPLPITDLDHRASQINQNREILASTLRLLGALRDRDRYVVPWCIRHLFVVPPLATDPLAELFFHFDSFLNRTEKVLCTP